VENSLSFKLFHCSFFFRSKKTLLTRLSLSFALFFSLFPQNSYNLQIPQVAIDLIANTTFAVSFCGLEKGGV
jgi:hypothetical protein